MTYRRLYTCIYTHIICIHTELNYTCILISLIYVYTHTYTRVEKRQERRRRMHTITHTQDHKLDIYKYIYIYNNIHGIILHGRMFSQRKLSPCETLSRNFESIFSQSQGKVLLSLNESDWFNAILLKGQKAERRRWRWWDDEQEKEENCKSDLVLRDIWHDREGVLKESFSETKFSTWHRISFVASPWRSLRFNDEFDRSRVKSVFPPTLHRD